MQEVGAKSFVPTVEEDALAKSATAAHVYVTCAEP